ncbi:uncharacterized protein V1518DRAFT_70650 [Limtongia smithiae]|uniref:uncharacterized protein n=1 Tax=Limtongia smithiae TaxID=1125753 RepID=UPI0034CD64F1
MPSIRGGGSILPSRPSILPAAFVCRCAFPTCNTPLPTFRRQYSALRQVPRFRRFIPSVSRTSLETLSAPQKNLLLTQLGICRPRINSFSFLFLRSQYSTGPPLPPPVGAPRSDSESANPKSRDHDEHPDHSTNESNESWGSAVSRRLHRPTKEELLTAATSAWDRFGIRFKWTLLRQVRPFNMDDMSAFFSWLIVGNVLWIILGTTTFFSLVLLTANTVFAQETLARIIGNYLTRETGITVVFESAIVPHWNDGVISFKNVFVSRRPGTHNTRVTKGSQATAAAAAAAAAAVVHGGDAVEPPPPAVVDDGNYTQFDLTVDSINVTLSFSKWMNGKGILKDVEVKGIRGVVDRTHVYWLPGVDPRVYKKIHKPGDFEIDHFVLEDSLVTLHQPGGFRPFQISIFSCDLPQLRRQWLFYDILRANHMSGSYDDSLFTIHPRQSLLSTSTVSGMDGLHGTDAAASSWKKTTRLRIDGVNIDHLNRGIETGAFSWITRGEVDLIADVMIPSEDEDGKFSRVMQDIVEHWETTLLNRQRKRIDGRAEWEPSGTDDDDNAWTVRNVMEHWKRKWGERKKHDFERHFERYVERYMTLPPFAKTTSTSATTISTLVDRNPSPSTSFDDVLYGPPLSQGDNDPTVNSMPPPKRDAEKYIVFDLRVQMHNVRAGVPLLTPELSYVNNALVRPIVAYMNNHNTYIPINCRVVKKQSEFDGSWTIFDSGLMQDLSAEVYEAIAANVRDDEERARRMRKVGMWSLQLAFQVFLMSMGTMAI